MTALSSGQVVPAPELAQVSLAACVLELSRSSGQGRFVERRWTLGEFRPLTLSLLASARVVADWKQSDDPEQAHFVEALYWTLTGNGEDFSEVSVRVLRSLERFESEAFVIKRTLGASAKYYEMLDDLPAMRLIRETAKVHGKLIADFADTVARTFTTFRVFPAQAEEAHYQWKKRQACLA